jgi:hypothetical protein
MILPGLPGFYTSGRGALDATPAGSSLLLDGGLSTSAARAYSLRKLRTAYAGAAIRVRRDNDNAEADIGFSGNDLDTAALATHVGANSGFIAKWYDQSGNGDDVVQATTGDQPRIRLTGTTDTRNSLPCIRFGLSADVKLTSTTTLTGAEALAIAAFIDSVPPAQWNDYSTVCGGSGAAASNTGLTGDGGGGQTTWYEGGNFTTIRSDNAGTAASVFGSVLQQISGRGAGGSWTSVQMGKERNNNGLWTGWIGEVIIFETALSAGDRTTAYTDQKTYWGTP